MTLITATNLQNELDILNNNIEKLKLEADLEDVEMADKHLSSTTREKLLAPHRYTLLQHQFIEFKDTYKSGPKPIPINTFDEIEFDLAVHYAGVSCGGCIGNGHVVGKTCPTIRNLDKILGTNPVHKQIWAEAKSLFKV